MITVLLAACNGQAYIKKQLDSILDQTLKEIRILASDDCSSDGTFQILKDYEALYPDRIRVIRRQSPSGGAAAHFLWLMSQTAAAVKGGKRPEDFSWAAQGEYFMLSDQDDVWLPDKALALVSKMRQLEQPGLPVLVHSDMQVVNQDLQEIAPSFFAYQKIDPRRCRLSQLLCENNVTGASVMINRPLLALMEHPPKECLMHDAWLALTAACLGTIGWVDEPLYLYRQHTDNSLGAKKKGSLKSAAARILDPGKARENYRRMFVQAENMEIIYQDKLSLEQKQILRAFVSLAGAGRFSKIRRMIHWGFTKSTPLRTLGQMLCMPVMQIRMPENKGERTSKKPDAGKTESLAKTEWIKAVEEAKKEPWPEKRPLVSICCITFNHQDYIRQTLEGFLMQNRDFPIEILIHDDASTDGTQEIIREYLEKYPDIIRPILRTQNQYSRGISNISIYNFPRVHGKYIAMCEGDDCWTDPDKLRLQVEFLESHPDFSLCFHSAAIVSVDGSKTSRRMRPYDQDRVVLPEEIVDKTSGYPTASLTFRAEIVKNLPDYYLDCPVGDIPMQLMMAQRGKAWYMDRDMCIYRVGVASSWTTLMKQGDYEKKQRRYYEQMRDMYRAFDRETQGRFHFQAVRAARRIYFLTQVNTKHYDVVMAKKYREFYRELDLRTRFFIRFEILAPGLYEWVRRMVRGKNN